MRHIAFVIGAWLGEGAAWLPFAAGTAALTLLGLAGRLELSLAALASLWALGVLWLLARRLISMAVLFALLLAPLAWQLAVGLPRAERALRAAAEQGAFLRLAGTVRGWERPPAGHGLPMRFRLGEAMAWMGRDRYPLPELEVRFDAPPHEGHVHRRQLRIGGHLVSVEREGGRLVLALRGAEAHPLSEPLGGGWGGVSAEGLRQALRDRAGYYLPKETLAVYLPVVLGVQERDSPEARQVVRETRRVGIAHLFAISGLHVGLIFLILMAVQHAVVGRFVRNQGWAGSRPAARVAITIALWGYMALIGFPIPAVRAAVMGTMIVWSQLWGTRSPRFYVLLLTAAGMLALVPSQLYDLSFQLSFLAYACVVCAVDLWEARPRGEERPNWARRAIEAGAFNLLTTFLVTVGMWPVIAAAFRQLSLLVFVGNLLMIPLLSLAVLPAGLVALGVSALHLGSLPGGLLERGAFGLLDGLLAVWVWIVRGIDRLGSGLVFRVELGWEARAFFLYYLFLTALLVAVAWLRAGRGIPPPFSRLRQWFGRAAR